MGKRTESADLISLRLHLQEPLHRGVTVRPAVVDVCEPLPRDPVHATLAMEQDAEQLADVLGDTLPGATVDLLIAALMGRRASTLRVGLLSVQEIADLERLRGQRVADTWADGVPRRRCGATCSHGRQCDGTEPREWHDHRHSHLGLLDCTWTEAPGSPGEATTGAAGDADTPASAESTGEAVGAGE